MISNVLTEWVAYAELNMLTRKFKITCTKSSKLQSSHFSFGNLALLYDFQ